MNKICEPSFYEPGIQEWPEGERPCEKMLQWGPGRLADSELLAILIRNGSKEHNAVAIARTMLTRLGNLRQLSAMEVKEFQQLKSIGRVKAARLAAAFELGRRAASQPPDIKIKVTDPEIVFRRYAPRLSHLKKEIGMVLILNSANSLIRDVQISEGILDSSLVHPREVFRAAILEAGASIILLHNHPSGEVQPSQEDKHITRRLVEAGKLVDIPVLDHIIIGQQQYFSFREAGLIE